MFKSFRQNANDLELTDVKEYILFKDDKEIDIRTGKTKTKKYLVIQAQYECNKSIDSFQTKLTLNNLKEKSTQFSSVSNIDQSFVLFTNLFDSSEVWVKDIINKNYLKLVFKFQKKDLEINLPYKKNEKNIFYHKSQTYNQSLNNINIDENLNINEIQKNDINEIKEEELNKEEEKNKEEEENKERQSEDEIPNNNINNQEEQNKNKDEGNNIIIENNGEEKNNINNININNINENKEQIDTGDNKIENENIENKKEILNYNSNIKEEQDKQDKTNINDEIQNDNNIINEEGEYFQFTSQNHPHPLTLLIIYKKEDFICSQCNKNYQWRQSSYYCSECDYHICYSCKLKEKKGSYYQLSCYWHKHVLTPCKVCNYSKYKCTHCGLDIINKECHFCTLCNYYLCLNCFEKYKDNYNNKEIRNEKNKLWKFDFFNLKNSELDNHRLIKCEFKDELNKKCLNCKKKEKELFYCSYCDVQYCENCFFEI